MSLKDFIWKNFCFKQPVNYPFVIDSIDLRRKLPDRDLNRLKVLNVGVGSGESGLARQLPYLPFFRLDLIDVHQPYLDNAIKKDWAAKHVNFINADIRNFDTSIYDVVLMFDVLEHLPKEDSLAVMKKIKAHQIIFIPLEEHFRKNTFGAESQDHLSLWEESDFVQRGYCTDRLFAFHKEQNDIFDALWATKNFNKK